ncbi:MAG: hypothetical protein COA70_03260 [Planctomycetota bacterium]|nr:MAG: hypothetical protein COA70_03260 [Planctomycetota bacterium]
MSKSKSYANKRNQPHVDSFQYLKGGPVVVFRWANEPGWPVEYVSPNVLQMFGHTADDFLTGRVPFSDIICPEELARVGEEVAAAVEDGLPYFEQAYHYLHKDGSKHHLYDYTLVLRNEAGEVTHFEGYVLDDTERQQATEALREEEEDSRYLVEIAELMAGDLSYDELCRHALQAMKSYIPVSKASLYMQNDADPGILTRLAGVNVSFGLAEKTVFDLRDNPWYLDALASYCPMLTLDVEEDPRCEGEEFKVADLRSLLVIPMRLTEGKSGYISMGNSKTDPPVEDSRRLRRVMSRMGVLLSTAMDRVTILLERERMTEQLQHAHRMEAVGMLAGGVAHNFNNTLTVILGYTSLLLQEEGLNEKALEKLRAVLHAGESSAVAVRQLLDFSRKQKSHQPELVSVDLVMDGLAVMLKPLVGEGICLELERELGLGSVLLESGELEMVLMNLAVNARDAMEGKGRLLIRAEIADEGHLRIAVQDSGSGMTDLVKRRMFEPFFSTKPVGSGTGLGLAAVYGVVQRAEGSIEVESQIGKGTTFSLLFPRNDNLPAPSINSSATLRQQGAGRKILLVEDQAPVRNLASDALLENGFEVEIAENGSQALELMADGTLQVDLLLSDVVMPEMDGLELSRQFSKLHPEVPIMLMSGFVDRVFPGAGEESQGIPFLRKPFTAEQLIEAVVEAIALG